MRALTLERMLLLEQAAKRDRTSVADGVGLEAQWLRACLAEQRGLFREAADLFGDVREGLGGEERAAAAMSLARMLLALKDLAGAWRVAGEAVRFSQSSRLLRQAERFYKQFRKVLPELPVARATRIALVGSVTLNFLAPVLEAQLLAHGVEAAIFVGGFGQYQQEVLDPGSELARFAPQIVVVTAREADVSGLRAIWAECRDRLGAFVIQCNFEVPAIDADGRLGGRALRQLNMDLWAAAESESGVAILDLDQCASVFGKARWNDPVQWFTAKQYPSTDALPLLGQHIVATVRAVLGLSKKCLALDLDGVLWGGVIGEDGMSGIELGGSARGEAFLEFQRYAQRLAQRGVLLAVCSKNNREDALEPFREHPEMVLKEDDIAVFVANWNDKDANLRAIARELNIGLDSIVFVDDNPMERARVRQNVPEVEVVELPVDPAGYVAALDAGRWFEALTITGEDTIRGESIRQNQARQSLAQSTGDVDAYLTGLAMRARLAPFDEANLPRIVQLINKTNQFNLTTRRVVEGAVRGWIGAPGIYTQALRLEDRFGDSGLTGVLVAFEEGDALRIDTWLMSCRILGRRLDEVMLASLLEAARERGVARVIGEYIATAKNAQVAGIYERFGFMRVDERHFELEVAGAVIEPPSFLAVSDLTRTANTGNM